MEERSAAVIELAQKVLRDRAALGPVVPMAFVLFEIIAAAVEVHRAYVEEDALVYPMMRLGTALESLQNCRTSGETECLRLLARLEQVGFGEKISPDSEEAWLWSQLGQQLRDLEPEVKAVLLRGLMDPLAPSP